MLAIYFGQWDYWQTNHNVTIDGLNRRIVVNPGVLNLDIQTDVYSNWKEWARIEDNLKYSMAIRTIGGDPTALGHKAGDIYFMTNRWVLVVDLTKVRISGVLYSDDYESALIDPTTGEAVYSALVSSLVTGKDTPVNVVTGDLSIVPTATENADALLEAVIPEIVIEDSVADYLKNKILSVKKFIGLS